MIEGQTFIIISDVDWEGHRVCEQQISDILCRKNKVLYIEQTRTLLWFFSKSGGDTGPFKKLQLIFSGLRKVGQNLWIVSSPPILPFRFHPLVYYLNSWLRRKWLKGIIRKGGFLSPIIITFDPDSADVVRKTPNKLSVYYRNDNHSGRGLWFNPDHWVSKREEDLIKTVTLVFALSQELTNMRKHKNATTFIVPNGVNLELFKNTVDNRQPEPEDLRKIPHPRIGVVGMLDWRMDVEMMEQLAKRNKDLSIVFVGPVRSSDSTQFMPLQKLPNVHFLGKKAPINLPYYFKGLDIGLIPYKINNYTRGILSLKIFEYSAAGIPTISTPLPESQRYAPIIHIAENFEELETKIKLLLQDKVKNREKELAQFAEENTWQNRVEQISQIIAPYLKSGI